MVLYFSIPVSMVFQIVLPNVGKTFYKDLVFYEIGTCCDIHKLKLIYFTMKKKFENVYVSEKIVHVFGMRFS